MSVELIYLQGCPHVGLARERLRQAFAKVGETAVWREWERDDPAAPDYVRACGSPTILVDGRDIDGTGPGGDRASACRIYTDGTTAIDGAPTVDAIAARLRGSDAPAAWRSSLAAVPAIGAAALPKLTCPACWPAYSGLLGAVGAGFVDYTPYLLPLTLAFLLLSLLAMSRRAARRRDYGPLFLGLVASVAVLIGKFAFDADDVMYAGIALLVAASLWNAWPSSGRAAGNCPACDSMVPKGRRRKHEREA